MHLVRAHDAGTADLTGLPWPDPRDVGAATLLRTIRQAVAADTADLRLVLPAPGDVRGLPAGTDFARAALAAGEGVILGDSGRPGIGLVPSVEGPDVLRWTAYPIPVVPATPDQPRLGESELAMRHAIREAAAALTRLRTVPSTTALGDPRARVSAALAARAHHRYPDSMPPRAVRILDSADQVAAILSVAAGGTNRQAPSASGAAAREDLLRPLWSAVRAARLGAVAASVHASHHA